jgi:hypothetical protein
MGGFFIYAAISAYQLTMNEEGSMTVMVTAQVLLLSLGGFIGVNSMKSATELQQKNEQDRKEVYVSIEKILSYAWRFHDNVEETKELLADIKQALNTIPQIEKRAELLSNSMVLQRSRSALGLGYNLTLGLAGILVALLGIAFTLHTWAAPLFASVALMFFIGHLSTFVFMIYEGLQTIEGTPLMGKVQARLASDPPIADEAARPG